MFTGLIEEVGVTRRVVRGPESARLLLQAKRVLDGTRVGDSIAVSGTCLTVVEIGTDFLAVDCMAETLEHSTLRALAPGDQVNLERALAIGQRLGGHLVLGHVDAVASIRSLQTRGIAREIRVSLPPDLRPFVAAKGSVALDGISLTITDVTDDDFGVGIIPHTWDHTTLRGTRPGCMVNLEADVLARYVHRSLEAARSAESGPMAGARRAWASPGQLTEDYLRILGFVE